MERMVLGLLIPSVVSYKLAPYVSLKQKMTEKFLDAHDDGAKESPWYAVLRPQQTDQSQTWETRTTADNTYILIQKSSSLHLDAHDGCCDEQVVLRTAQTDGSQEWVFTHFEGDYYKIQQKSTLRYLDAYELPEYDYRVVTREEQHGEGGQSEATQLWLVQPAMECTIAAKVGGWKNTGKFSNGQQEIRLSQGTESGYTSTITASWGSSVTRSVEAGFELGAFSASASVSKTISSEIAKSQSRTFSTSYSETYVVRFEDAGVVWQWVWDFKDACGASTSFANAFVLTSDVNSRPCCLPGYFSDPNNPRGGCLEGSPRDDSCADSLEV